MDLIPATESWAINDDTDPAIYLPSPAEIEAACLAIQATWSDDERLLRRGNGRTSVPFEFDPKQVEQAAREALLETTNRIRAEYEKHSRNPRNVLNVV